MRAICTGSSPRDAAEPPLGRAKVSATAEVSQAVANAQEELVRQLTQAEDEANTCCTTWQLRVKVRLWPGHLLPRSSGRPCLGAGQSCRSGRHLCGALCLCMHRA